LYAVVAGQVKWPTWDKTEPELHTVFGLPEHVYHHPNHNIVRKYSALTVYDDEVLSSCWTAIKMTHHVTDKNSKIKRPSRFKTDPILREKGYEVANHDDYKNPTGSKLWNRGHMVQFDGVRDHGKKAATDSFYTTNVCPELAQHNQRVWLVPLRVA
jgi:DNA/RNA endonuclease G (NUC1)